MYTFDDYSKEPNALSLNDFAWIHTALASAVVDDDAGELYEELVEASIKYSGFRSQWLSLSKEERLKLDESRSLCHDKLIIKFNQLARYAVLNGRDTSWRDKLGYTEDDPSLRKRIGDFGCYLAFIRSLQAR